MLSESYKNKLKTLSGIPICESKKVDVSWEYQLRDVGGPVFYKRKSGEDWVFTSAEDFALGLAGGGKLVNWNEKS